MDAKLIMFRKDGKRKEFSLGDGPFIIGRGENCELRIPFVSVSRHHCQLAVQDGEVSVKDLGSSNGTFVNNKKIAEEQAMKAGDRIIVGPVIFTLQIDGEPEEIRPPKLRRKATQPAGMAAAAAETGAPVSGEESDPIAALEDLVAEALKDEEEEEDDEEEDEKK